MNTISECIHHAVKAGYTLDFFMNDQGLSYNGAEKVFGLIYKSRMGSSRGLVAG